ncbi:hypothetical protein BCR35DRAFT_332336 [Leucosporidium creatinivorum]|uniref:DUF6534 domain-containing protein n=1 Tax=Leucosporidium creatinivorum TaxID=106004 RepID=A0A1Y2F686_9BASI|nr:hypothetical protein BCR35DRAFT_332336 [Leucosporidium creatinivorum]
MDASTFPPEASQKFVNAVLGAPLVGWTVQLMFFGFACSSFLSYLDKPAFQHDSRRMKCLLFAVMFFLCLQSTISMYSVWHYGTNQNRDEDTLYAQTVADCFATGPVAVAGALVQGFLAHRASSLFKNTKLRLAYRGFIYLCITTAFLGAILYIACSFIYRAGKDLPAHLAFGDAVGIWLWSNACIDIFNTITLLLVLRKRIMHWNEATDNIIRRLMKLAVQTAFLPAVLAVIGAAMAFSFNNTSPDAIYQNVAGSFYQPLSSLYAISLLATLASRGSFGSGQPNLRPSSELNSLGLTNTNTRHTQSFMPSPYLPTHQLEAQRSRSKSKSNGASGLVVPSRSNSRVDVHELPDEGDLGRRSEGGLRPDFSARRAENEKDEEAELGL